MHIRSLTLAALLAFPLHAQDWTPAKIPGKETTLKGREVETFRHDVKEGWGYQENQLDTFVVIHPTTDRKNAPLYVVLHSAGHDVMSCVECTKTVGNHDIYHSPEDFYALYLDCRANKLDGWWGGMHVKDEGLIKRNSGGDPRPVERRVIDTVKWVIKQYGIDPNRVYLAGNSMGGSGALGIGMRNGDTFAAIKANVPAGIEHVSQRMYFPPQTVPEGVRFPDPPICVDYSAPNDSWSLGHERFVTAMNDRKYALYFYWGPFGHSNTTSQILKVNDLVHSFDWLGIKKNEAYAVFTNASDRSVLPWPDDLESKQAGQVNAFFRWKNVSDTADKVEMSFFLVSSADLKTTFAVPVEATADVSLRRLQKFNIKPGERFKWTYGKVRGEGQADAEGVITIPDVKMTGVAVPLSITKG